MPVEYASTYLTQTTSSVEWVALIAFFKTPIGSYVGVGITLAVLGLVVFAIRKLTHKAPKTVKRVIR